MKQIVTIILLIFLLKPAFGQKHFDIPETRVIESFTETLPKKLAELDLKDLRGSEDSLNVRIWQNHEVFTINFNDSTFSDYKIYTSDDELVFKTFNLSEKISTNIMDSLTDLDLMGLDNENYRGIDGSFVFIEISTKSKYKIASYWSPVPERSNDCRTVVSILERIDKEIESNKLRKEFLNSLPPGRYRWGMTGIRIDKFLDKDVAKSDFYSLAEEKIKLELSITDNTKHWNYPLIVVDNKPAMLSDLNKYDDNQISNFEIIKSDDELSALYGTKGSNGVVKVETK